MNIALVTQTTSRFFDLLNRLQPLWWLLVRIWVAIIFFKSGLTKLDDFETTIFLFAEEYKVPFIPPELAAYSGTLFELICPILLVLGLGSRVAALPLLAMTAVIQFTYLDHLQHYYWGILLAGIIFHGAGKWSLDYLVKQRIS
jgi:putative oxidoreductase